VVSERLNDDDLISQIDNLEDGRPTNDSFIDTSVLTQSQRRLSKVILEDDPIKKGDKAQAGERKKKTAVTQSQVVGLGALALH
jgi:hypothetical protein